MSHHPRCPEEDPLRPLSGRTRLDPAPSRRRPPGTFLPRAVRWAGPSTIARTTTQPGLDRGVWIKAAQRGSGQPHPFRMLPPDPGPVVITPPPGLVVLSHPPGGGQTPDLGASPSIV